MPDFLDDPRNVGALTGAAVGAGGLGLLGYLSGDDENRKRNALLAALLGGAAGGGLGYWAGTPDRGPMLPPTTPPAGVANQMAHIGLGLGTAPTGGGLPLNALANLAAMGGTDAILSHIRTNPGNPPTGNNPSGNSNNNQPLPSYVRPAPSLLRQLAVEPGTIGGGLAGAGIGGSVGLGAQGLRHMLNNPWVPAGRGLPGHRVYRWSPSMRYLPMLGMMGGAPLGAGAGYSMTRP